MLLLNNFIGQIKENSVELIANIFAPLFIKVKEIGVCKTNTSEI